MADYVFPEGYVIDPDDSGDYVFQGGYYIAVIEAPPAEAIQNQIKGANLGADLYNGTLQ